MTKKNNYAWLWVSLIIAGAIIIGAIILSSNNNSSSSVLPSISGDNIDVEILDMEPELDAVISFTYDCDWVSSGNTIKCSGAVTNTGQNVVIDASNGPLMVIQDSDGCSLDCSDRENLGEISSGQKVDYTLSCTLPKKQNVKVTLSPAGGIIVTKC